MTSESKRPKRSAVQRWNDAVREAHAGDEAAAVLREVLAASDEEVDAQLRVAGVDVEALNAESDESFDALLASLGQPRGAPEKEKKPPR